VDLLSHTGEIFCFERLDKILLKASTEIHQSPLLKDYNLNAANTSKKPRHSSGAFYKNSNSI